MLRSGLRSAGARGRAWALSEREAVEGGGGDGHDGQEPHRRQDAEHETDPGQRAKMNAGDEGYPDIEGCKRRDVGWYKQSARFLVPRAYHLLMNDGWYQAYRRPPAIGSD